MVHNTLILGRFIGYLTDRIHQCRSLSVSARVRRGTAGENVNLYTTIVVRLTRGGDDPEVIPTGSSCYRPNRPLTHLNIKLEH